MGCEVLWMTVENNSNTVEKDMIRKLDYRGYLSSENDFDNIKLIIDIGGCHLNKYLVTMNGREKQKAWTMEELLLGILEQSGNLP